MHRYVQFWFLTAGTVASDPNNNRGSMTAPILSLRQAKLQTSLKIGPSFGPLLAEQTISRKVLSQESCM